MRGMRLWLVAGWLLGLAACGGGGANPSATEGDNALVNPTAYRLPEVVNAVPPQE